MPYIDKPGWIQHGGANILGLDIDPANERIATCGADNKIRIWSMRPVVSETAELDAAVPKQLAVLCESTTPVNCVRFAPLGRLLAAGSDDSDGYVFELRDGRGTTLLGSGEASNIDNWKLRLRLRGHATNVTDVTWAPDSGRLATASVDNRVKIWDATTGHCIRTLEGHMGHVKGVAWDPFDLYLASQSDKELIVWRLEDGAQACCISEPFVGAPIVSFALRPSWSPDGQVLMAPNGYENGVHTVPIIARNTWAVGGFALVGHRGTVTVVRHNPHLFCPPAGGADGGAADNDAAASVTAVGSTDKAFSVWRQGDPGALMAGRKFFKRMVNDMAWSADGRMLVVASTDGTVVTVVFEEAELGRRLPEAEMQALLAQLYGDPQLRNQKAALPAAPDLLQLEARARADELREERLNSRLGAGASAAAAAAGPAAAAGALRPPAPAPLPPLGNGTETAQPAARPASQQQQPAPPQVVTGTQRAASPAKAAGTGTRLGGGRDPDAPPAKRPALQPVQAATAAPPLAPAWAATSSVRSAAGLHAALADGLGAAAAAGAPQAPGLLVPPEPAKPFLCFMIHVQGSAARGEPQVQVELQASNTGRDARNRPQAEIVCLAGARRQWSDTVQGQVLALAGSSRLVAASTAGGDLLIYSAAGRRLFPPIRLGHPASFLSVSPGSSLLLALLADGQLRTWDFAAGESLLETSVAPLLAGEAQQQGLRVANAKLNPAGSPVVVLTNAYAYVYNQGLRCWMRVADDAFPASAYTSSLAPTGTGELSRLQAKNAQRRTPQDVLAASGGPQGGRGHDRALLEHNMAAAAALQSPGEWRAWLITYARRLAADEDESRLRDLISELMGPLRWSPATHTGPPGAAAGAAAGRGSGSGAGAAEPPPLAASVAGRWQPTILGLDKRRMLREVVLKEVAKNRTYQQLVSEVLDQLKQLEAAAQPPGAALPRSGGGAAGAPAPQPQVLPHPQPQHQPMVLG